MQNHHWASFCFVVACLALVCQVNGRHVSSQSADTLLSSALFRQQWMLASNTSQTCQSTCQRTINCLSWMFCAAGPTHTCKRTCKNHDGDDEESMCSDDELPGGTCIIELPAAMTTTTRLPARNYRKHAGWSVGHTDQLPSKCRGLSSTTCRLCLKSRDPSACLLCARNNPGIPSSSPIVSHDTPPTNPEQCGLCHSSKDPEFCFSCISDNQPCKACISTSLAIPFDECLTCSAQSYYLQSSCVDCSRMGPRAPHCFRCLHRIRPNICPPGARDLTGCIPADSNICTTCATPGVDHARCTACAAASPFSEDCLYCPQLATPTDQRACFTCAASGGISNGVGGCYDCLLSSPSPQTCLRCMQDPHVSPFARSWCNACTNWFATERERAQCVRCLRDTRVNYVKECGPAATMRKRTLL